VEMTSQHALVRLLTGETSQTLLAQEPH